MYRIIEEKLKKALKNRKKAIVVSGPRQVGKTYTIRKVLKDSNKSFYEINFFNDSSIKDLLFKNCSIEDLIEFFEIHSKEKLIKGESIIFLDEIQECPEIVTKIKFLVDEGSYQYVLSGSLLGIELKNIKSLPIGYASFFKMYPMNFYEFIKALKINESTLNYLEKCYKNLNKIDESIHNKLLKLFYYYLVVGGMPQVVNEFINSNSLKNVWEIQNEILSLYIGDFSKYETLDKKLRLINIYRNIPSQLNKQNLKFKFKDLDKELKFDRYENSFLWLIDSGVALAIYIAKEIKLPLILSKEKNSFKLFLSDVGLLSSCFSVSAREELIKMDQERNINKGGIFENFVAQELNFNNFEVFYFKDKNLGEIDFCIELNKEIRLIEVKSGVDYKSHRALNNFINKVDKDAFVLSLNNIEKEGRITYLPIYLTYLIKNEEVEDIKVDLSI